MEEAALAAARVAEQAAQEEKARKVEAAKQRHAQASMEPKEPLSPPPQPIWKPKATSTDKALDRLLLDPDELAFRKVRYVY
jgi:hypothetical protein